MTHLKEKIPYWDFFFMKKMQVNYVQRNSYIFRHQIFWRICGTVLQDNRKSWGLSDQASIKPCYLVSHIFSANYQEMESKSIMGRFRKVLIYIYHFTQQVNIRKTLIKKKQVRFENSRTFVMQRMNQMIFWTENILFPPVNFTLSLLR